MEYCAEKDDISSLEHFMKQKQNCGGYALEIPICIYSDNKLTFEEKVLRILELYPFTRLLSNTELNKNEYIVIYRAGENGHHFIKIDDNGCTIDKHECNLPVEFQGGEI